MRFSSIVDEEVPDLTSLVVSTGERSFQRIGLGLYPEDFSWTIEDPTPGEINRGQRMILDERRMANVTIVCPEPEDRCVEEDSSGLFFGSVPTFHVYKTGFLFPCRSKCVTNFHAQLLSFFGWRCGQCDSET